MKKVNNFSKKKLDWLVDKLDNENVDKEKNKLDKHIQKKLISKIHHTCI